MNSIPTADMIGRHKGCPSAAGTVREIVTTVEPIFAFGFERSGTTLLTMLLGAHPDIAVPFSVSGLWYNLFDQCFHRTAPHQQEVSQLFFDALFAHERIERLALPFGKEELVSSLRRRTFPEVFDTFHSLLALKTGKRVWANMDISTLERMHVANLWFPNARFIHLVRDGRDVALSHATMPYGAANTWSCARAWKARVGCNLRMGAMLPNDRYFLCKYEDLVQAPVETLGRICRFIRVPYNDDMLNYKDNSSVHLPRERAWLWPDLLEGLSTASAFRWMKKMRRADRIIFEREAGDLLAELGYRTFDAIPRSTRAYIMEMCQVATAGRPVARLLAKFGCRLPTLLERRAGRPFLERNRK